MFNQNHKRKLLTNQMVGVAKLPAGVDVPMILAPGAQVSRNYNDGSSVKVWAEVGQRKAARELVAQLNKLAKEAGPQVGEIKFFPGENIYRFVSAQ
jgi:hypothetical protein